MIRLFTPATGYPDLEVKIAYGLARVGIEAGLEFRSIPQGGYFQIEFKNSASEKLNDTFSFICGRLLSSDRFFDFGVKAKDKKKYSVKLEIETRLKNIKLENLFTFPPIKSFDFKKKKMCGHENLPKFGTIDPDKKSGGLVLLASSHAGKPYLRDKRINTFNLSLCEVCGYLAVLGIFSFGFQIQMGSGRNKKYVFVLPVPRRELTDENLQMLLSLQKTLHNFWLSDLLPLQTFTIGLLAKRPSISDIINNLNLDFHLTVTSKDNRGDTVIEQTDFINAVPFSKFISSSSYNSACIEKLLGNYKDKPKISSLIKIANILKYKNKSDLSKFARLYVRETSTNVWTNLLYPETTKYLKEVAMIKPEIIKNKAIGSVARILQYFIREREYHYADNIRNARKDSKDFEETVVKMLREGELRRVQQEQDKKQGKKIDNWIHLPNEDEIKELFQLANENFDEVKTALVILAFSFPTKGEEKPEIKEEVQNA